MYKFIIQLLRKWFDLPEPEQHCSNCEVLREQLSIANDEKRKLLDSIIKFNSRSEPENQRNNENETEPKAVGNKYLSWNARREVLEAEDREKHKRLQAAEAEFKALNSKTTEQLEKETGVN